MGRKRIQPEAGDPALAGLPVAQLAARWGCSEKAAYQRVRRASLPLPLPKPALDWSTRPEAKEQAIQARLAGIAIQKIARSLGMRYVVVRNMLLEEIQETGKKFARKNGESSSKTNIPKESE